MVLEMKAVIAIVLAILVGAGGYHLAVAGSAFGPKKETAAPVPVAVLTAVPDNKVSTPMQEPVVNKEDAPSENEKSSTDQPQIPEIDPNNTVVPPVEPKRNEDAPSAPLYLMVQLDNITIECLIYNNEGSDSAFLVCWLYEDQMGKGPSPVQDLMEILQGMGSNLEPRPDNTTGPCDWCMNDTPVPPGPCDLCMNDTVPISYPCAYCMDDQGKDPAANQTDPQQVPGIDDNNTKVDQTAGMPLYLTLWFGNMTIECTIFEFGGYTYLFIWITDISMDTDGFVPFDDIFMVLQLVESFLYPPSGISSGPCDGCTDGGQDGSAGNNDVKPDDSTEPKSGDDTSNNPGPCDYCLPNAMPGDNMMNGGVPIQGTPVGEEKGLMPI